MKKNYLIREYSEFDMQRFGESPTAQSEDPDLSHGAFDKHIDNVRVSNIRLNNILNNVKASNNIYNSKKDRILDGMDITDLKILRMFPNNEIDLDVYISFKLDEKEYFGVIKKFIQNPDVSTEAFNDPDLHANKEWIIKTKGTLIKVIKNWMNISPSKWTALKDIQCTNIDTGELVMIKKDTPIKVLRTLDNTMIISYNDINCELKNMNFYYFNYWFDKV
ncbi:MAG: hypothetical protein SLAVMIC_00202 [uncultured marine phage]|uniref:Uncharacterized protein n=1 Tax=uncultured marine phage TaxID=707152 RepID=A0A8D9CCN1_9VIRU|nr:MAG: hypothetical protein SLAVMIC_00202 [uncultured marine phage]